MDASERQEWKPQRVQATARAPGEELRGGLQGHPQGVARGAPPRRHPVAADASP